MTRDFQSLQRDILALIDGETDDIAKMATIACELYHGAEGYDWVGFYRCVADKLLKIGPYQGGHGCLSIAFDQGVCGHCASTQATVIVDDVEAFEGHIACSTTTKSEIVVPVFNQSGHLIAVLDVDSDTPAAFSRADAEFLENLLNRAFA